MAEIAERHLAPTVRARVKKLLGPGVSLASVSTWSDDVKFTSRRNTYNWHFVDIPLASAAYDQDRDCRQDPEKGDCIVKAIARLRETVRDHRAGIDARREALKQLVHLVGDLHQPLHTVLEETGGNGRAVRFFTEPNRPGHPAAKEKTNLHAVWDQGLIRHCVYGWGAYVDRLVAWLADKDSRILARGSVVAWTEETHKLARDVAFTVDKDADLGEDYVSKVLPTLDRQLAVAGLRLARLLNEDLGSKPRPFTPRAAPTKPEGWQCS